MGNHQMNVVKCQLVCFVTFARVRYQGRFADCWLVKAAAIIWWGIAKIGFSFWRTGDLLMSALVWDSQRFSRILKDSLGFLVFWIFWGIFYYVTSMLWRFFDILNPKNWGLADVGLCLGFSEILRDSLGFLVFF